MDKIIWYIWFQFQTTQLLADMGGQLGLWIGISALTMIEASPLPFLQLKYISNLTLKIQKIYTLYIMRRRIFVSLF